MSHGKRVDILVTGAGGQLGMAINNLLAQQTGPSYVALPKSELNIGNEADMRRVMEEYRPRFVVNCAADTKVNRADLTPTTSWDVNGRAVSGLARWCARIGASLIHLSTDFVFGRNMGNTQAYEEDDVVGPVNNYGTSKLVGEYEIMRTDSETVGGLSYYIIRTAGLFCMPRPLPTRNFPTAIAGKLANEAGHIQVVDDVYTNITRAEDLARAVLHFIWQPKVVPCGIYHVTNPGEATWFDVARHITETLGYGVECLEPISRVVYRKQAEQAGMLSPSFTCLDNGKYVSVGGPALPHWTTAISDWCDCYKGMNA